MAIRVWLVLAALGLASGCRGAKDPLQNLRERIASGDLANVHGVMVVQDGKPRMEWYFTGTDEVRESRAAK